MKLIKRLGTWLDDAIDWCYVYADELTYCFMGVVLLVIGVCFWAFIISLIW